jgi:hypothetical protein
MSEGIRSAGVEAGGAAYAQFGRAATAFSGSAAGAGSGSAAGARSGGAAGALLVVYSAVALTSLSLLSFAAAASGRITAQTDHAAARATAVAALSHLLERGCLERLPPERWSLAGNGPTALPWEDQTVAFALTADDHAGWTLRASVDGTSVAVAVEPPTAESCPRRKSPAGLTGARR